MDLLGELQALLSEPPDLADERARAQRDLREFEGVVLYGAGSLGRSTARRLAGVGLPVAAFADDTPGKAGSVVEGVPVFTLQDSSARYRANSTFVVTILNNALGFREARARLLEAGIRNVASFFELAWALPETFLPHGPMTRPSEVLRARDTILSAFQLFADEESRRQFIGHIRFRLHLELDALPLNSHAAYFPSDLIGGPLPPDCVFIDCGAYDGDTVADFVARQQGEFGAIHAFEPDPSNLGQMAGRLASLPGEFAPRVHIHQAAVGSASSCAAFAAGAGMGSALRPDGELTVPVVRVDEQVETGGAVTYLKFDVEGAEAEALQGSQGLLSKGPVLLAVSTYHRPADLWELPQLIRSLCPDHRLHLRTEGEDGADTICYALPVLTGQAPVPGG